MKPARSLRPLLAVLALVVLSVTLREPNAAAWGGGSPTWVGGPLIPFAGATNGQCIISSGGQWVVGNCTGATTFPASWTANAWCIDAANVSGCASDANNGTTCTCGGAGVGPLLTQQGLSATKWGCLGNPRSCPRLRQNTTITYLSTQATSGVANTDPLYLYPALENGASLFLTAALPTAIATGTYNGITTKNRATATLLTVQLAVSAVTGAAVGELLVNSTHASRSWLYKTNPANPSFSLTQPLVSVALPGSLPAVNVEQAEVDTSSIADAWALYNPIGANIAAIVPVLTDYNGTSNSAVYVNQLTLADPNGAGLDNLYVGAHVHFYDTRIDRAVNIVETTAPDEYQLWSNVFLNGGWLGGASGGKYQIISGGALNNAAALYYLNQNVVLDGDTIWNVNIGSMAFGGLLGLTYIESLRSIVVNTGVLTVNSIAGGYSSFDVWGPGALTLTGEARVSYNGGAQTGANSFQLTGAITMNGSTTAALCSTGTTLTAPAVTLTGAHLDAACAGATGFGGRAFTLGGASIVSSLQ